MEWRVVLRTWLHAAWSRHALENKLSTSITLGKGRLCTKSGPVVHDAWAAADTLVSADGKVLRHRPHFCAEPRAMLISPGL
jgi:hypothetical protein